MKYEKWSLGYWFLKSYVRFVDWIIHKKVVVVGLEKIPKQKPILFAPNHQNALSDPLAILLHSKFQPVWLARADIFKNKFVAAILKFLKIMPVYRMRDGKDNLLKNDETFEASIRVLEHNFSLALFPEAAHSGKRQMLDHKKAIPRIVFLAEEKSKQNLDIQVIPVGIYYSNYWKFNRYVIVNYGTPIEVNNFVDEFKINENNAVQQLRQRIYDEIDALIINIKSQLHYKGFENIRELYGRQFLNRQHKSFSLINLFQSDRKLVKELDALEVENPNEAAHIVEMAGAYLSKITKLKLRSWLVFNPENNFLKLILNSLILLVSSPVFAIGFILNAAPYFFVDFLLKKKVKDNSFRSSFSLGLGLFVFPIFYLIEMALLVPVLPGFWAKIGFLAATPILGKIAFNLYILGRKTVGRFRLFMLEIKNKKAYHHLIAERDELFSKLDKLISLEN